MLAVATLRLIISRTYFFYSSLHLVGLQTAFACLYKNYDLSMYKCIIFDITFFPLKEVRRCWFQIQGMNIRQRINMLIRILFV